MNPAPVVKRGPDYPDDIRAEIAGYLLHMREGTLRALESSERGAKIQTDIGLQNQAKYYSNCEEYSRFLLYWIGYEVMRKRMYYGEPQAINP